jgi:hypothetical protein
MCRNCYLRGFKEYWAAKKHLAPNLFMNDDKKGRGELGNKKKYIGIHVSLGTMLPDVLVYLIVQFVIFSACHMLDKMTLACSLRILVIS